MKMSLVIVFLITPTPPPTHPNTPPLSAYAEYKYFPQPN